MEKGIYISDEWIPDRDIIGYDYIYYGSEFCMEKIARLLCLDKVINYCEKYDKTLCYLTPFVPEANYTYFLSVIEKIAKSAIRIEVIVNDYGMLRKLHEDYKDRFVLTYGRLLNRKKKSPTIMNLFGKFNEDSQEALQTNAINNTYSYRILEQFGINNLIYENVYQGNRLDAECSFQMQLMFPYVQISTSRKCFGTCLNSDAPFVNESCDGSCNRKRYVLYNEHIKQEVILCGNTIMYKNEEVPADLESYSRIIINERISSYDDIKYFEELLLRDKERAR